MANLDVNSDYPIQSYYLFNVGTNDPILAFEKLTKLQVNQHEIVKYTRFEFENEIQASMQESWWNSFWKDGWSHIIFGTVSTGFGIGILCLATGPVGWVTGALAIAGGSIGTGSGIVQLNAKNEKTKQLYHTIGDVSLSLNNIPGLVVGTGSYVFTHDLSQSIGYADLASISTGSASLIKSGVKAFKMQRLYNLNVGLNNTSWSSFTRNINARLVGIDPKGLEASHLVPQSVIRKMVAKAPWSLKEPIEKFFNGPLCIHFMRETEHALVDPYRWRFLPSAQKEILKVTNPVMSNLMDNYPQLGGLVGFIPNTSPTLRPVVYNLVITSGRVANHQTTNNQSLAR